MPRESLDETLIAKIKGVQIRARHLVSEILSGQYESAFKGRGMEFEEVREYVPGDDIRHIDWNVTARMNRPFLKVHRDERELTVLFLVDVSGSGEFGSRERFKVELAAEVTALLAYTALSSHDKVGLIVFSDRVEHFLPAKKGRGHVWRVIRDILSYRGKHRRTDLAVPLDYLGRVQRTRAVVFLVSDFQGVAMPGELATAAARHELVAVPIEDLREREMPDVGLVSVVDAETGEEELIDTRNEVLRRRFGEEADRRAEERERFFRRHGIESIPIRVDENYLDAVVRFFRARGGRA